MRKGYATFANFICKFDEHNLLDYAAEIVVPAFIGEGKTRFWGRTSYHFLQTRSRLVPIGSEEVPVVFGRFVINKTISREQVLEPDGTLRVDPQSLQSSPSAFFALFLHNHRLAYFAETEEAPSLKQFEGTIRHFLRDAHREYSSRAFTATTPKPKLEIIPIIDGNSIEEIIAQYTRIRSIRITAIPTNDDFDFSDLLTDMRKASDVMGVPSSAFQANSSESMKPDGVKRVLSDVTNAGSSRFVIRGNGAGDEKLKSDNDSMSLDVPIKTMPSNFVFRVKRLYGKLLELAQSKAIRLPTVTARVRRKAEEVVKRDG